MWCVVVLCSALVSTTWVGGGWGKSAIMWTCAVSVGSVSGRGDAG